MIYQTSKILKDVRMCMDEDRTTEALLESDDIDTLALDELIQSKILEAVERVHMQAPYHLMELGHTFDDDAAALYWGDQESGWVLLPTDFMRLLVFEMSDWERAVYSAISPDNPEYKKQRGRVKALRGTAQRPVCALCVRPEGKVLEFYSCTSTSATVTRAVYTPYPSIDDDGGVDISEHCYPAVVHTIAGLVASSCGETDKAAGFFNNAKTFLER